MHEIDSIASDIETEGTVKVSSNFLVSERSLSSSMKGSFTTAYKKLDSLSLSLVLKDEKTFEM